MREDQLEKQLFWAISGIAAVLSAAWCLSLGDWKIEGASLPLAACTAAFLVGSLIGFVFTIFGEEIESLGKIRSSMIALASGVAGLSLASVDKIGSLVGRIQLLSTNSEKSAWFSVLFTVSYFVAGFYFMYLLRKLVLNPALEKSRIELERIQITGRISSISLEIEKKLPQKLLLGKTAIADVVEDGGQEKEQLNADLSSDAVIQFLSDCQKDLEAGSPISPDNVAKAAVLHYYRCYFESESSTRRAKQDQAVEWINRALLTDPLDAEFQIKLADVFDMQGRYGEAVAIFERLERNEDSPQYVQQWLGYFLLFIEGREKDAISQSLKYHDRFPDEADSLFNASCGYAQLYMRELAELGAKEHLDSENRKGSLTILEQAVRIDPDNRAWARKHTGIGESFESLASDRDFIRITSGETAKNAEVPEPGGSV